MKFDKRWNERVSWAVIKMSSKDDWIRWNCWVRSRYSFRCENRVKIKWRGTNTTAENSVVCSPRFESNGMTKQLHHFISWLLFRRKCVQEALNSWETHATQNWHVSNLNNQETLVMKKQIIFKDASISSFISLSGEQPRRERFLSRNFRLDQ